MELKPTFKRFYGFVAYLLIKEDHRPSPQYTVCQNVDTTIKAPNNIRSNSKVLGSKKNDERRDKKSDRPTKAAAS